MDIITKYGNEDFVNDIIVFIILAMFVVVFFLVVIFFYVYEHMRNNIWEQVFVE